MRPWQAAKSQSPLFLQQPLPTSRRSSHPYRSPSASFFQTLIATPGQAARLKSEVATIWSPLGLQIVWQPGRRVRDWRQLRIGPWGSICAMSALAAQSAPQPLGAVAVIDGRMRRTIYVSRGKVRQFVDAAGIRAFDGFYDRLTARPLPRPHRRPRARASAARLGTPPRPRPDAPAVRRARRLARYEFDADDLIALRALRGAAARGSQSPDE